MSETLMPQEQLPNRTGDVHFSSESVEWATPQWLFDALNKEFGFTVDVCCTHENAKCAKHYTRSENGLLKSWSGEVVWMNPPYGHEIPAWMSKAFGYPRSTTPPRWHSYAMKHEIRFLRGRLYFNDTPDGRAPFPYAIVVMRPATFSLQSA